MRLNKKKANSARNLKTIYVGYSSQYETWREKNQFDGFDCVLEFSLMFCKQKL